MKKKLPAAESFLQDRLFWRWVSVPEVSNQETACIALAEGALYAFFFFLALFFFFFFCKDNPDEWHQIQWHFSLPGKNARQCVSFARSCCRSERLMHGVTEFFFAIFAIGWKEIINPNHRSTITSGLLDQPYFSIWVGEYGTLSERFPSWSSTSRRVGP